MDEQQTQQAQQEVAVEDESARWVEKPKSHKNLIGLLSFSLIIAVAVGAYAFVYGVGNTDTDTNSIDVFGALSKGEDVVDAPDNIEPEPLSIVSISESSIVFSNGSQLSIDTLPDTVKVSSESEFGSSDRFKNAVLSPTKEWLAISVSGSAHDFGWLYTISDAYLRPVQFSYGGSVDIVSWISDTQVEFEVVTPKPETLKAVTDVNNPSEYPKI